MATPAEPGGALSKDVGSLAEAHETHNRTQATSGGRWMLLWWRIRVTFADRVSPLGLEERMEFPAGMRAQDELVLTLPLGAPIG